MDINKCIFTGRLGADPELRSTTDGVSVCTLSLAVEKPKAKDAEKAEVDWFKIVCWRERAEFAAKYLKKGSKIVTECEAQTRSWVDKHGGVQKKVDFLALKIVPADAKREADSPQNEPTAADELPF